MDHSCYFMSCVCHAFAFVHCCLVVTCWEIADIFDLDCYVYCVFVTFPCGILGKLWYLIVSIPDFCHLSYFSYFYDYYSEHSLYSRIIKNSNLECALKEDLDQLWYQLSQIIIHCSLHNFFLYVSFHFSVQRMLIT